MVRVQPVDTRKCWRHHIASHGSLTICCRLQVTFKRGDTVRWLLVDPVSQGQQGYHDPYFTNQARPLASTPCRRPLMRPGARNARVDIRRRDGA